MARHVVLGEGLLDQKKAEFVEAREVRAVIARVRRIGVHLQGHLRSEDAPNHAHGFEIPAGLDLEFDAHVAVGEIATHHSLEFVERVHDAHRDSGGNAVASGSQMGAEVDSRTT